MFCGLASALGLAAALAAAQPPPWRGLPLVDALSALRARGLTLVFTDAVVTPDLVVVVEPATTAPREILDEILKPLGLAVREGPEAVLVVVSARKPPPAGLVVLGQVVGRSDGVPIARARVIADEQGAETETDATGRFSLPELGPGTHRLRVEADGYLERVVDGLDANGSDSRPLCIELDPSPFVQDSIVVQPSRLSLLYSRPESLLALARDEIEQLPHLGDDLFRAISLLPGAVANDVTAQFSVHGGRRDEVEIRLDGQELYDAFHLADYDNATSIVSARSLAGASLSTGAFPASRGDRMSGVLELETVEPRGPRRFAIGVGALDLSASGSGELAGGRGGWTVHARRGSLDLAADAIGRVGPAYWDLLARVDLETKAGRWRIQGLATGDDFRFSDVESDSFEQLATDYLKEYLWLSHEWLAGERALVESRVSWSRSRRDRRGRGDEEKGAFDLDDQRRLDVWELAQDVTYEPASRRSTRFGWLGRRYDARFDYRIERVPTFEIEAPFAPPRTNSIRFAGPIRGDHVGLYWSERRSLGSAWTAEAGLRFDRHDATEDSLWSPRLNLARRLGERAVLRAGWGVFRQSQRPYELDVEDGRTALARAERSEHAVLGFEMLPRRAPLGVEALRVELYRRAVDRPRSRGENLLETQNYFQEIEPDRVVIVPESGTAEGVEVLVRGVASSSLRWWVGYSWAHSRERVAGATAPRALDERHGLAADLALELPRDWRLNLAGRWRTGWPTTPIEVFPIETPEDPGDPGEGGGDDESEEIVAASDSAAFGARFGRLRSERLPDYLRFDLRASRRWATARGALTFYVDIQNLTDRRNLAGYGLVVDDEAGVTVEPENWPGVVPSLGLVWEF